VYLDGVTVAAGGGGGSDGEPKLGKLGMLVPVQPGSAKASAKPANRNEQRGAAMTGSLDLGPILRANSGERKPPRKGKPAQQGGQRSRFTA
jgi:hypothetical protein